MIQRTLSIVVVLWWAVAAFAEERHVQVAGIVRSAATGEALKSAVVILRPGEAVQRVSRATTGADGSFTFSGLAPGKYQLTVSKSGYGAVGANAPVTIAPDSTEPTRLALALWPGGAIGGRVVDWDGEPVADAEIRAYVVADEAIGATLSLASGAESNDLGEYRLFGLPAGRYVLQVSPPRGEGPSGQFYADAPAVYYPGAPSPAQAVPVELNWGDEVTRADVRVQRGQGYIISGSVWDAFAEGPCRGCTVRAVQFEGPYSVDVPQTARVSAGGAFVLRALSSGDYVVVAEQGRGKGALTQARLTIRGRSIEDARLTVGLHQAVTGQVVLENPPEGIDTTDWMPRLSPVGPLQRWPRVEGEITEGRQFKIEDVPPAQYRFELARLPAGAYLKTLRSGGKSLAGPDILVSPDSPVSGLEAVVAFDGAIVQGKASSPPNHRRIYLVPSERSAFLVPMTTETGPDGAFTITSIPPGGYTLHAVRTGGSLESARQGNAIRIHLDPSQVVTIDY